MRARRRARSHIRATSRWLVKRILPSLEKRKRMRTSAPPLCGKYRGAPTRHGGRGGAGWRRGQESYRHLAAGREILPGALATARRRDGRGHHVLDPVPGAGPAVVAGGPAAVGQAVLGQGVLPVLPQEV